MKAFSFFFKRRSLGLVLVIVGLSVLFGLLSEHFFSILTLTTIANQIPSLLLISSGMTLVIILGGIDLSVGSVMAFSGSILGMALTVFHLPIPLAILAALFMGLLIGVCNGFMIVRLKAPEFIVTLGMLEITRGLAYLTNDSKMIYLGSTLEILNTALPVTNLSLSFVLALFMIVFCQGLLSFTVLGRYIIGIGSNETAVRLSGIKVDSIKWLVYGFSGVLTAVAGITNCARLSTSDPNTGIGMELSSIAAVVIGGTSLRGGSGSVFNTFFGVVIISVLQTGLAQIGATEPLKKITTGGVIVAAVVIDELRRRYLRQK